MLKIPRILRLYIVAVLASLMVYTAMRGVFWYAFHPEGDPMAWQILLQSCYVGFKFDLRLALLVNLPLALFGWIGPLSPFRRPGARFFWNAYLTGMALLGVLFYLADFGHYAYLQSRLNVTALRFLYNFDTSARMVWESYPVVWALLGVLAFAFGFWHAIKLAARRVGNSPEVAGLTRWRQALVAVPLVLAIMGGIYGKVSWYPLRWSDAFFAPHPFSSSLALNPVLYFAETLPKSTEPYTIERVRENYDLIAWFLGVDRPDAETLEYRRHAAARRTLFDTPPNVVIVILESFTHYKTGAMGNPLDPTPHFDRIAREGTLFTRFYTPAAGTARSVFALVTGLPDVEVDKTSSRNPLIVDQHTIINAFEGYDKLYFLGGSLSWANVRGLLQHNIPGLDIHEEGSYSSPRVDVWGISDYHLFGEANEVLRRQDKPFLAIIQTSGNHRPYTIPEDNGGFVLRETPDDEVQRYGFYSTEEFNSFRFMDHAIGRFMELAAREPYFKNTVFVFFGDHGLPGQGEHMAPEAEEQLTLTRFHVPLAIYAPGAGDALAGVRLDHVASELDVLPTVASLAGVPYVNSTFGRNLFDPAFNDRRYVFTVYDQSLVPEITLMSDRLVYRMLIDGSQKGLHDYLSADPRADVSARYPEHAAFMERLVRAIYETARYMPYANAARTIVPPPAALPPEPSQPTLVIHE